MEKTTFKEMLIELMQTSRDETLQEIYDSYLDLLPLEKLPEDERKYCEFIAAYFKAKFDIIEQLDELIIGHEGMCEFQVESDTFTANITCYVKHEIEKGYGKTPDYDEYNYSDLEMTITVTPE